MKQFGNERKKETFISKDLSSAKVLELFFVQQQTFKHGKNIFCNIALKVLLFNLFFNSFKIAQ